MAISIHPQEKQFHLTFAWIRLIKKIHIASSYTSNRLIDLKSGAVLRKLILSFQWRQIGVMVAPMTSTKFFVQELGQANNKKFIKCTHYSLFLRGFHLWWGNFLVKCQTGPFCIWSKEHWNRTNWGTPNICQPAFITMAVADILAPNRCQAICNYHPDKSVFIFS